MVAGDATEAVQLQLTTTGSSVETVGRILRSRRFGRCAFNTHVTFGGLHVPTQPRLFLSPACVTPHQRRVIEAWARPCVLA